MYLCMTMFYDSYYQILWVLFTNFKQPKVRTLRLSACVAFGIAIYISLKLVIGGLYQKYQSNLILLHIGAMYEYYLRL
jgi:hypothetical protein